MKRRSFLGSLLALTAAETAGGLFAPAGWVIRQAQAYSGKTLVVVFLRGACDGLNVVVPYGEDAYHRLRPAIRIPAPGAGSVNPAIDLDGFFGLHPSLRGVADLYFQGKVALLPAVQYADASRSHFEGQDLIERAGVFDGAGWLNRYLATVAGGTPGLAGLALGRSVPVALRGSVPVGARSSLVADLLSVDPAEEAWLLKTVGPHYREMPAPAPDAERRVREAGAVAIQNLALMRSLDPASYLPAGGASYPDSDFGRSLRNAAILVKNNMGLEVANVDLAGWDTHRYQGNGAPDGVQARALAHLDAGLEALLTDLGPRSSDVCVLVMTEFGRTAKQNGSGGTDHGNASTWMVLGGGVQGGIHLGPAGWPGLELHQLREGRDLMHTIDYRNVMAEILGRHLGSTQVGAILPGHKVVPIGFMGA